MLRLNLTSQSMRQEYRIARIYSFVKAMAATVMITALALTLLIIGAKLILANMFSAIVAETSLVSRSSQNIGNKTTAINEKVNQALNVQDEFIPWSKLIGKIAEITDNSIGYYNISIDYNTKSISLGGRAGTREALLELKAKLEKLPYFTDVNLPISDLLKKEDITFAISAKINPQAIKELKNSHE